MSSPDWESECKASRHCRCGYPKSGNFEVRVDKTKNLAKFIFFARFVAQIVNTCPTAGAGLRYGASSAWVNSAPPKPC